MTEYTGSVDNPTSSKPNLNPVLAEEDLSVCFPSLATPCGKRNGTLFVMAFSLDPLDVLLSIF